LAERLRDESFAACRDWLAPSPWLPQPDVPALIIGGREDALVPPPDIRRIAVAWRANARIVPQAGHCPLLDESGFTVARLIERWLFE
jgi:pimeloyl-ACP methyl ester carboxylesterase